MPIIAKMLQQYAEHNNLLSFEGTMETIIPGVYVHRATKSSPRQPLIYNSGIIVVGQGRKIIHFPEHQVNYPSTPLRVEQWVFSENFDKNKIYSFMRYIKLYH